MSTEQSLIIIFIHRRLIIIDRQHIRMQQTPLNL